MPRFRKCRNLIIDRCDPSGLIIKSVYYTFNNEFGLRINTNFPFFFIEASVGFFRDKEHTKKFFSYLRFLVLMISVF